MTFEEFGNKVHIENLGYILLMPIFIDFLSVSAQQLGMSNSSRITLSVYVISLFFVMVRVIKTTSIHDFCVDLLFLLLLYLPFEINYLIFPQTRNYIMSQDMLIVYVFFFPVCVFSIRKIRNWESFDKTILAFGNIALSLSIIILLFLDYKRYLVYMGFSYALLPFICVFYRAARENKEIYSRRDKLFNFIKFSFGLISILVFGARAVIVFVILYVAIYELIRTDVKLVYKLIASIGICFLLLILMNYSDEILSYFSTKKIFRDSYTFHTLINKSFLESRTRDMLYEECINRIQTMGLSINGFFGDREYCVGFPYPHNIIYEILMSQGWIFGIIILISYCILIIRGLFTKDVIKRDVLVFTFIAIFARYFVSGSYLVEGKFWIATVIFWSVARRKLKLFL